jgi:tRNA threonylcarbamoyladenosine biosynthesis protein TsaB
MTKGAWLALDAASSRLTVAVERTDGRVAERHLDGPRRHAAQVLVLIDEVLSECGITPREIGAVLSGDGPGSFTGLRVATSVAKALVWRRDDVAWYTASSLLSRIALTEEDGARVLAVSDALRGELYAGCWDVQRGRVEQVDPPARAMHPEDLARFGTPHVVAGTVPDALRDAVALATGRPLVDALPDARNLLALRYRAGGVTRVEDPVAWHPEYGRPAEAQVVWERKRGHALPDPGHTAR